LDPLATGVLVVLVGPATRLAPYLTAAEKTYEASIVFGSETDTDDSDGAVTRTAPVPTAALDRESASAETARLVGEHLQTPPDFSAIKRGGVVAHRAARAGSALVLEPRPVTVFEAALLDVVDDPAAWTVRLRVSKGTYIRALARDLGRSLGTAAHLGALRRVSSGSIGVEDAVNIESLDGVDRVAAEFLDPVDVLGLHVVEVDPKIVGVGAPLVREAFGSLADDERVACVHEGRLLAVYRVGDSELVPDVVIPGGCAGGWS
jgi:tRNA pseudouridine55 synthase